MMAMMGVSRPWKPSRARHGFFSVAVLIGLCVWVTAFLSLASASWARAAGHGRGMPTNAAPRARDDTYTTAVDTPLTVPAKRGVLANDSGSPLTVVSHTDPEHGALQLSVDGAFTYTPQADYRGTDSFTYTITNAVQKFSVDLPPLATVGGVPITAGGYGSSVAPVPRVRSEVYGLTDRGPNVEGPGNTTVEPVPDFHPAIGKFRLVNGKAVLKKAIPLRDAKGNLYSGLANSENPGGPPLVDIDGNRLPTDPNGYDSEGLVALADGTFWVSDEYGPFITHFDAQGRRMQRLSPLDGTLPAELARRAPNRGLEGLTITPDGNKLVAIMQAALPQPDLEGIKYAHVPIVRIVTYELATHRVHEYLYLLDNPITNQTMTNEITALSNTTFLVDERDWKFPPGAYKRLWKIDLTGATDVGPLAQIPGATYDSHAGGLLVKGQTLEGLVRDQDSNTAAATLAAAGILSVSKKLFLDVGRLLDTLDARGRFFNHDKFEGVAPLDGGRKIVLSNDSDFGIDGVTGTPPYKLHVKIDPATGKQDDGEFLIIDMTRLPPALSTARVSITVK